MAGRANSVEIELNDKNRSELASYARGINHAIMGTINDESYTSLIATRDGSLLMYNEEKNEAMDFSKVYKNGRAVALKIFNTYAKK